MKNKNNILLFAAFFVLYELTTYLSNDMIMPAMVDVVKQFKAPLSNIASSLSLYIIGGSLLQIFLGPIADHIGKRKVLIAGNLLFLLATAVIPLSSSIHQFLAARLFQGMGMCFIFIGYAMVHELFNDVEAIKLTSLLSNIAIFAPLLGPVLGSGITAVSSWEWIFVVSGVLGVTSLFGLIKYMPPGKLAVEKADLYQILHSYRKIFTHKTFMSGILIFSLMNLPLLAWVGLSPVIILDKMHQSFAIYITYQAIVFSGFILSSILIQKIAGKFSAYTLITRGVGIACLGLTVSLILRPYPKLFMLGMFIYSFGFGLYCGTIVRLALMSTGESTSLSSSAMSLLFSLCLSSGLELYNLICDYFGYSLLTYSLINFVLALVSLRFSWTFAKQNKDRQWNSQTIQVH